MENILYYYKNLLEFDLRKNKCQLSQTDKQSSTHPNKIQTELKNHTDHHLHLSYPKLTDSLIYNVIHSRHKWNMVTKLRLSLEIVSWLLINVRVG